MVKLEDIKKEISDLSTKEFDNDFELQLLQLKRVLSTSSSIVRSIELREFLYQGVTHTYQPLKELSFYLLSNQTKDEGSTEFLLSLPFLNLLLSSIVDENPEVARLASNIIASLGITLFSTAELNSHLLILEKKTEISKMRVGEVVLRIASKTPDSLEFFIKNTEWYQNLLNNLKSSFCLDDPLITLNILESIEVFYTAINTNFQQCYLHDQRSYFVSTLLDDLNQPLIQLLSSYVISNAEIQFENLVVPAILRILSQSILIYYLPFNHSRIPVDYDSTFLQLLKEIFLKVGDESIIEAAIQSVSAYAVSIEGNNLLFNSDVFREYLTYLESRNELFFRSFIHSIANTIRSGSKEANSPVHLFCAKILTKENLETLESILTRPTPEIRDIIYQLLDELTATKWGRNIILSFPSIVYFLFNRENEFTASAMSWRFSILRNLSRDRDLCIHLNGDQFYLSICNYLSDGEFINEKKTSQVAVADEHF